MKETARLNQNVYLYFDCIRKFVIKNFPLRIKTLFSRDFSVLKCMGILKKMPTKVVKQKSC